MDDPTIRHMRANKALKRWTIVVILVLGALNLAVPYLPSFIH
ncbi:hypothetical protein [Cupriavidus sp. DL-D2]